ncbi:MAG: 8-oxo-dGTP diphosphatase [Candidatus Aenigmarchaeota archaeon]|nr:8-oxo-dGTP diphosphatase [Candidatus Aenigmarchaeota archaeon]
MEDVTLLYVIKDGRILLIKSKRGISEGKWNGPGGHVEEGESPADAAIRETIEETGVTPLGIKHVGRNEFYIGGECAMKAHIFVARDFSGETKETEEGIPNWFSLDAIPLNEMWPDDEIWIPVMLEGKKFSGKFYYDEGYKNMINYEIEEIKEAAGWK